MAADGKRKRIVHVFSTFAPGGPQRRTVDLIHALPDKYHHTILAIDNNIGARAAIAGGAPVETLMIQKDARGRVARAALRRQILAARADLIITYNWGASEAIQALLFTSHPTLLHAQDGFGPDEAGAQIARRLWARRFLYRFVEAVVVPSRNLERIATEQWWLAPRRVLYIPNGIDVNKYRPGGGDARAAFRAKHDIPAHALCAGTVAHLRAEKRPVQLLEAFAKAAPAAAFLAYVGDGPERGAIERRAAELGVADRVRFAGHLADTSGAYGGLDIFCLSSNTEQMPIAVLEAMGCGLPIISTDVGDIQSMVSPSNEKYVTKLGDDGAFAASFAELCASGELRARVGAANRGKCVSHYSLEQQTNAYRDLYDHFTQQKRVLWRSEHFRNN